MKPRDDDEPEVHDEIALPPALKGSVKGRAVVFALRRHMLAVAGVVLLAGVAAVGVYQGLPPARLVATTVFQISSLPPSVLTPSDESKVDFATYRQSQATLFKHRNVINAVIANPEIRNLPAVRGQSDPAAWLEKQIQVDFKMGPEFMRVTLEGHDADELQQLLDALTQAYQKQVVNKDRDRRQKRLDQLTEIHTIFEEKLRKYRQAVTQLAEQAGSCDPQVLSIKQKFKQEQVALAQKELLQVRSDLRKLLLEDAVRSSAESATGTAAVPEDLIADLVAKDAVVVQHKEHQAKLAAYLAEVERKVAVGATPSAVIRARQDLAASKESLEKHVAKIRPEIVEQARDRLRRDQQMSRRQLQERIALLKELEKPLADEANSLNDETRTLNTSQLGIEARKQEISHAELTATRVQNEVETLKVELDAPSRVTLLEEPRIAAGDEGRRRLKYGGLAGAVVLAGLIGLIVWRECRLRRVTSAADATDGLGLKLIGTVPLMEDRPRLLPWSRPGAEQESRLAESMEATRTMLMHAAPYGAARALLVTSALSGEGKTSLACRLATSLARAGHRTLLIDGDMRRPSAHRMLDLPHSSGLSEVLRGEATADEVTRPAGAEGLWLIAAGHWNSAASRALAGDRWGELLTELRSSYDFVIIDSSPVLPVADALHLARRADGVVLAVMQHTSQLPAVHEARQRLEMLGARVLGVVVNGAGREYGHNAYYYRSPAPPQPA
jgi:capsular exopolysaccharide synthesis family protein